MADASSPRLGAKLGTYGINFLAEFVTQKQKKDSYCGFELSRVGEYFISRPSSQPTHSWQTRVQRLNVNITYR